MYPLSIGDIHNFFVWTKADSIRPTKPVRYGANPTCGGIVAIDLIWQSRAGPDALFPAVNWIREPDRAIRVYDDVVGRVERTTMEG
jgi:hypothetical protein